MQSFFSFVFCRGGFAIVKLEALPNAMLQGTACVYDRFQVRYVHYTMREEKTNLIRKNAQSFQHQPAPTQNVITQPLFSSSTERREKNKIK